MLNPDKLRSDFELLNMYQYGKKEAIEEAIMMIRLANNKVILKSCVK